MKALLKSTLLLFLLTTFAFVSCEEDDDSTGKCYTCDECSKSQYQHLLDGREYCVDGFDNKAGWEANKKIMEDENGCTCK